MFFQSSVGRRSSLHISCGYVYQTRKSGRCPWGSRFFLSFLRHTLRVESTTPIRGENRLPSRGENLRRWGSIGGMKHLLERFPFF